MRNAWLARTLLGFVLAVSASHALAVRPATGFWSVPTDQGMPGSGLNIDVQKDHLAVSIYTYRSDGTPTWFIAQGPLVAGVFEASMESFASGTCLECPFTPAQPTGTNGTIRLQFLSATTGNFTVAGVTKPIQHIPFGVDSLLLLNLRFPYRNELPDMLARWVVVSESGDPALRFDLDFHTLIYFDPPGSTLGDFAFEDRTSRNWFRCYSRNGSRASSYCTYERRVGSEREILFSMRTEDVSVHGFTAFEGGVTLLEDGTPQFGARKLVAFRLPPPS